MYLYIGVNHAHLKCRRDIKSPQPVITIKPNSQDTMIPYRNIHTENIATHIDFTNQRTGISLCRTFKNASLYFRYASYRSDFVTRDFSRRRWRHVGDS